MSTLRVIDARTEAGERDAQALRLRLMDGTLESGGARHVDGHGVDERGAGLPDASSVDAAAEHELEQRVASLLSDVRRNGDRAVCAQIEALDKVRCTPEALRVPEETLAEAHASLDAEVLAVFRRAAENIRRYQSHIRITAPPPLEVGGRSLGVRYTPLDRVGLYVPGGKAFYPSSLLMTAVPALVAGVPSVVIATPPKPEGLHPMLAALAYELGIREVLSVGGATAIAALAFGTESIAKVDKIVGPGNAYVAEAKRQVFGRVGIDAIAGPSEVLILADASAQPAWVAADMLAQAEHDPGSAVLLTSSMELALATRRAVEEQLPSCTRHEAIAAALASYCGIICVRDRLHMVELANAFASEHVEVMVDDAPGLLAELRHGGAFFVGPHTPVSLGDYVAGPSHVLPTSGTARFFGPLSVNDFMKASSVVSYDASSLEEDGDDVVRFALLEGLDAHAAAVTRRRS